MIDVRIVDSLTKVFPDEPAESAERGIALSGQNFGIQVSVCSDAFMYHARFDVLCTVPFRIRRTEFVPVLVGVREWKDDYYLREGKAGVYPDPIMPCGKYFNLVPGLNTVFFLDAQPCAADVGEHVLQVAVYDENGMRRGEKEYCFDVQEVNLPTADLMVTDWLHADAICHSYGVEPFSERFYEIFRRHVTLAAEKGINTVYVPLLTPSLDVVYGGERMRTQLLGIVRTKTSDRYRFDFEPLAKFLKESEDCGAEYFEFSHLFTQWGAKFAPVIYAGEERIFGWDTDSMGEEYRDFLRCLLPQLRDWLEKRGVFERCLFHISDEPKPEDRPRYAACKRMVDEYLGEARVTDALSDYSFYAQGVLSFPVVSLDRAEDFRSRGVGEMGVYACFRHGDEYFSNRFLTMPLQRTRVIGFQMYLNRAKMFLHYGFNFYNDYMSEHALDPYWNTDAGRVFPGGDGYIVYPDRESGDVRSSLRLEAFGKGFEDYRLMLALEAKYGREYCEQFLRERGFDGWSKYPRSVSAHNAVVRAALNLLQD